MSCGQPIRQKQPIPELKNDSSQSQYVAHRILPIAAKPWLEFPRFACQKKKGKEQVPEQKPRGAPSQTQ